jgi:anti-sigma regulatory factor (Ser/Thr protein kinase)
MRGVGALQQFATERHVPEHAIFGLALALEESASNIVNHALKRDAQRTFQLVLERTTDSFVIELRDDGPPFDPTAAESVKPQTEDDDALGGWGVELVRRNVDEIRYRRENDRNVLRLIRRLVSAPGGD